MLNNLDFTRLDADVFQSILETFASFGGYPAAYFQIENSNIK
jgi:hypothetical protein